MHSLHSRSMQICISNWQIGVTPPEERCEIISRRSGAMRLMRALSKDQIWYHRESTVKRVMVNDSQLDRKKRRDKENRRGLEQRLSSLTNWVFVFHSCFATFFFLSVLILPKLFPKVCSHARRALTSDEICDHRTGPYVHLQDPWSGALERKMRRYKCKTGRV